MAKKINWREHGAFGILRSFVRRRVDSCHQRYIEELLDLSNAQTLRFYTHLIECQLLHETQLLCVLIAIRNGADPALSVGHLGKIFAFSHQGGHHSLNTIVHAFTQGARATLNIAWHMNALYAEAERIEYALKRDDVLKEAQHFSKLHAASLPNELQKRVIWSSPRLWLESKRQSHCIYDYRSEFMEGTSVVASTMHPQQGRVTTMLRRVESEAGDFWYIHDQKGKRNQSMSATFARAFALKYGVYQTFNEACTARREHDVKLMQSARSLPQEVQDELRAEPAVHLDYEANGVYDPFYNRVPRWLEHEPEDIERVLRNRNARAREEMQAAMEQDRAVRFDPRNRPEVHRYQVNQNPEFRMDARNEMAHPQVAPPPEPMNARGVELMTRLADMHRDEDMTLDEAHQLHAEFRQHFPTTWRQLEAQLRERVAQAIMDTPIPEEPEAPAHDAESSSHIVDAMQMMAVSPAAQMGLHVLQQEDPEEADRVARQLLDAEREQGERDEEQ